MSSSYTGDLPPDDSIRLICACFDNEISEAEGERLKTWLRETKEHRGLYARLAMIHSGLHQSVNHADLAEFLKTHDSIDQLYFDVDPNNVVSLLQEAGEAEAKRATRGSYSEAEGAETRQLRHVEHVHPNRAGRRRPIEIPRGVAYAASVAAMFLLVSTFLSLIQGPVGPEKVVIDAEEPKVNTTSAPTIATITDSILADWGDPHQSTQNVRRLTAGEMVLKQGVVGIDFDDGARVIGKAPLEMELLSASRIRVNRGRLVAKVPKEAIGFTVISDAAAIVDLGTEFGVDVNDDKVLTVHVFEGEVALAPKETHESGRRETLTANAARKVSSDGATVVETAFDRSAFLRAVPGSAYELAVLEDRPVAFWRMNEVAGAAQITSRGHVDANGIAGSGVQLGVTGDRPERGNLVARFNGEHEGITVGHIPELALPDTFTIEAWIHAPDTMGSTAPQRLLSNFHQDLVSSFQTTPEAGFAFGVIGRDWTGDQSELPPLLLYFSFYGVYDCISEAAVPASRATHVAVAVNGNGRPRLYVDGQPVGVRVRAEPLDPMTFLIPPDDWDPKLRGAISSGPCYIGCNPPSMLSDYPPERWQSAIDEIAIFSRVLGDDEIHKHYRVGLVRAEEYK